MSDGTMKETILQLLQEIRPETNFENIDNYIDNGCLDSFDIINLVAFLDEKFSVSIDGVEITPENFQSLNTISSLVRKSMRR